MEPFQTPPDHISPGGTAWYQARSPPPDLELPPPAIVDEPLADHAELALPLPVSPVQATLPASRTIPHSPILPGSLSPVSDITDVSQTERLPLALRDEPPPLLWREAAVVLGSRELDLSEISKNNILPSATLEMSSNNSLPPKMAPIDENLPPKVSPAAASASAEKSPINLPPKTTSITLENLNKKASNQVNSSLGATSNSMTSQLKPRATAKPALQYNSASNSSTYQSQASTEYAKFQRLAQQARIFNVANSPFFPKNVQEFNKHKAEYKADQIAEENKKIANLEANDKVVKKHKAEVEERYKDVDMAALKDTDEGQKKIEEKRRELMKKKVGRLMKPMDFSGTAVLAQKSIWGIGPADANAGSSDGWEKAASGWPTREEMKWEGEHQAKQGLPRRLPVPRENKLRDIDRSEMMNGGAEEEVGKMERGEMQIPWRMKKVVETENFDETVKGREDRVRKGLQKAEFVAEEPTEQISKEEMLEKGWLGKDLLKEMGLE